MTIIKRLMAAGVWLLVAAVCTYFVWTTHFGGWPFCVLLVVAALYANIPNWWTRAAAPYIFSTTLEGSVYAALLMTFSWLTPVTSGWPAFWNWPVETWLPNLALAGGMGWLAAKAYMLLELKSEKDRFADDFKEIDVWEESGWEDIFPILGGMILYFAWLALVMSRPLRFSSFGEVVFYGLLFAWFGVWLGKLLMTIQAMFDHRRKRPRYYGPYLQQLKQNKAWAGRSPLYILSKPKPRSRE